MKKREFKIVMLIFWSVLIDQIHLLLSSMPVNKVDLILFADVMHDVQWYVYDMGEYLSSLFILIAVRMLLPYKYKLLGTFLIIATLLDIINYWLFFHQFDWIYKSIAIILPTLLIINNEKRNNNRASH